MQRIDYIEDRETESQLGGREVPRGWQEATVTSRLVGAWMVENLGICPLPFLPWWLLWQRPPALRGSNSSAFCSLVLPEPSPRVPVTPFFLPFSPLIIITLFPMTVNLFVF